MNLNVALNFKIKLNYSATVLITKKSVNYKRHRAYVTNIVVVHENLTLQRSKLITCKIDKRKRGCPKTRDKQ